MTDVANSADTASASLTMRCGEAEQMQTLGQFHMQHWRDGVLLHEESFPNLVTTVGKNTMLDKLLDLGAAHSAIHLGLKQAGTAVIGDTMSSHASWSEGTVIANRGVPSFSAASGGVKATSSNVSFSITGTQTIAGCFIVLSGTSAVSNTTGTLFSAGDFTGGNRAVLSGDTLTVSYSLTIT
jgi:hypothetical protein